MLYLQRTQCWQLKSFIALKSLAAAIWLTPACLAWTSKFSSILQCMKNVSAACVPFLPIQSRLKKFTLICCDAEHWSWLKHMPLKAPSSANLHALSLLKQMCDKLGFCHALVTKLACSLDFCLQVLLYMFVITHICQCSAISLYVMTLSVCNISKQNAG